MIDDNDAFAALDFEPWTGPEDGTGTLPDRQTWDATFSNLGLAYKLALLDKGQLATTLSKMDETTGMALVGEIGSARELLTCMTELLSMIEARLMVAAATLEAAEAMKH